MEQNMEVLDSTLALASVGGDVEFLAELAGITEAAWPTLLQSIREALADGDLPRAQKAAHLVRITAENLFARRAYLAAFLLESKAGSGELERACQATSALEEEMNRVKPVLADFGKALGRSRC